MDKEIIETMNKLTDMVTDMSRKIDEIHAGHETFPDTNPSFGIPACDGGKLAHMVRLLEGMKEPMGTETNLDGMMYRGAKNLAIEEAIRAVLMVGNFIKTGGPRT